MNKHLEKAIHQLLQEEPFFGHFILNSTIIYDPPNLPTAAAAVRNGVPILLFNTQFLASMSEPQRKGVLKHEIMHLLFAHVNMMPKNPVDMMRWNLAMDCAINQFIETTPDGAITLESFRTIAENPALLAEQTSQYYYDALKKVVPPQYQMDDHGYAVEGADDPLMASEAIRAAAKKAVEKSAGNVSKEMLHIIDQLPKPQLPWRHLLRNFVARQAIPETRHTTKRPNRRFELDAPGKVKKRCVTLGVCVDSSGSISDEAFAMFLSEVKVISGQVSQLHLIDADCEVQSHVVVSKQKKLKASRTGAGGTAYQPAIDYCTKLKCDAIIYFGDFDSSDTPKDPRVPFLWVGVGSQEPPGKFGKVVRLGSN